MKVDCLMGTYGRFSFACESLACFLHQSALADATILIYNQHPVPLVFDHPRVRVVNVVNPSGMTLRDIRAQMLALANPEAEFIHFWDDDDLYLPWHLEDCLNQIGKHVAWKQASSWILRSGKSYDLTSNMYEATWMFRTGYVQSLALDGHPSHSELPIYMQTIEDGLLSTTEMLGRSSYIYRWYAGQINHSSLDAIGTPEKQRQVLKFMRNKSVDVSDDGVLVAPDMTSHWKHFLAGTKNLVTPTEWEANRNALGIPEFTPTSARSAGSVLQRLNPFSK